MSQWFVRGWKVSTEMLESLVGAHRLTAGDVLDSTTNDNCRGDVVMTLGRGDAPRGHETATRALNAILDGKLEIADAYLYARVLELLLNHVAIPLAHEYDPRWRSPIDQIVLRAAIGPMEPPLLAACRLHALASTWAVPNVRFPWPATASAPKPVDWPVWTAIDPAALVTIESELDRAGRADLDALPDELLLADATTVREELWTCFERLRSWVARTRSPETQDGIAWARERNALVLVIDGDQ